MKFIAIFCVIGVVLANDDLRIIDSIQSEPSCSSRGGMCVIADDCPASYLVEDSGLCPLQQRMGVECCYGISIKETRCRRRGGECLPRCNVRLRDTTATDCSEDTVCCILVN
ncbi:uncharacterized protein LOC113506189 [Trichoplusia ni]|uniref:Uncharacterized protein LOC113506189 n=1 Tax=Trichoplusia ni TaxID=7111 RepID=A0A7E5WX18_TRINI|nr:uncharacterized protein LOC113506189 [Trichoplusia ni]